VKMRVATFGTDIRGVEVDDASAIGSCQQASRLWVAAPTAQIVGDAIISRMSVTNPTDEVVPIVVNPYGGTFPHGGDSPFTLRFSASAPVTYAGEFFPEEAPLPMHIDCPSHTQITFEATIDLNRWTWSGDPAVSLDWGFHFAAGTAPGGSFALRLPWREHLVAGV
jgi:hypothetical protein